MVSTGAWSTGSNSLIGGAYSLSDQQALRVGADGVIGLEVTGRFDPSTAISATFVPYVFGMSDPRLRPAV